MVMVRLLISDGSWLLFRTAEKAMRPLPERTDIPKAFPAGSVVGVESHTTKHFPSSTMGSVSFWPQTSRGPIKQRSPAISDVQRANREPPILTDPDPLGCLNMLTSRRVFHLLLLQGQNKCRRVQISSGDPLMNQSPDLSAERV